MSWPIRNPLYLPSTLSGTGGRGVASPQATMPYTKSHDFATEARGQSPLSRKNPSIFARPRTHPPQFSQFPKPPGKGHPMVGPSLDAYEDMSVDSWPPRQPSSHATADMAMPDMDYTTSGCGHAEYSWRPTDTPNSYDHMHNSLSSQGRQEKNNRQVVVTLRDDQLGQIVSY